MVIDYLKPENRIRATPLDLLKQGVTTRNWEAVDAAYVMLTGEPVIGIVQTTPEPRKRGRPKKVEPVEIPTPTPPALTNNGIHIISPTGIKNFGRTRSVSKDKRENKFVDDETIAPNEIAASTDNPCPRNAARRPAAAMVPVRCADCGKKEEVDPILAKRQLTRQYTAKYKCNDCIVGARGDTTDEDRYDNDEVIEDDDNEQSG